MLLLVYFLNFVLLCILPYLFFTKKSLAKFLIIVLSCFFIPSLFDKIIGSVSLAYGNVYTQFSFIDIFPILYLGLNGRLPKKNFFIPLIITLNTFLLSYHLLLGHARIWLLLLYWYSYVRVLVFAVFACVYLKGICLRLSRKEIAYISFFIFLLIFEMVVFSNLLGSGPASGRYQLPHLNVNVLPNALLIFFLILFVLSEKFDVFNLILVAVSILLTGSRTSLILLFFWIFFSVKMHVKYRFSIIVSAIFMFVANSRLQEIVTNIFSFDKIDTIRSRLQIWGGVVNIVKENYIFGIGPGQFYVYDPWLDYLNFMFNNRDLVLSAHNDFLQVAIANGVFFALIFFIFIFYVVIKYCDAKIASLIVVFLIFCVNSNLETVRFQMVFGMFLGVLMSLQNKEKLSC